MRALARLRRCGPSCRSSATSSAPMTDARVRVGAFSASSSLQRGFRLAVPREQPRELECRRRSGSREIAAPPAGVRRASRVRPAPASATPEVILDFEVGRVARVRRLQPRERPESPSRPASGPAERHREPSAAFSSASAVRMPDAAPPGIADIAVSRRPSSSSTSPASTMLSTSSGRRVRARRRLRADGRCGCRESDRTTFSVCVSTERPPRIGNFERHRRCPAARRPRAARPRAGVSAHASAWPSCAAAAR